jgi:hypothetical protein
MNAFVAYLKVFLRGKRNTTKYVTTVDNPGEIQSSNYEMQIHSVTAASVMSLS